MTPDQNIPDKGYGPECADPVLRAWAKFYGVDYFPLYTEVKRDPGSRFHELSKDDESAESKFLDTLVYATRIRRVVAPVLMKASQAGSDAGSHVRVKGLGLGVWQVDPVQEALMLDVYAEILDAVHLPGIAVLEFAWFPTATALRGVRHGERFPARSGHEVEIRFSTCCLADPVEAGRRLVAMYAWDANAYAGNAWWAA